MTRSPDTDQPGHAHRSPMRFRGAAALLVAVLVLAGCGDDDSSAAAASDPAAVIAAYEAAFNAHDLDAVVAVFATDAVTAAVFLIVSVASSLYR